MAEYIRWAALALIGLILSLVVGKQAREMSLLLTLAVCVLVSLGALEFLEPVAELMAELRRLGGLDREAVSILLKATGIGVLSELAVTLCADAGEGALGKVLQILSGAVILWLRLPLFRQILTLIEEVLAGI